MKALYKLIRDRCNQAAGMKWVDKDKGQLDHDNPEVAFPCTLIKIVMPNCETISRGIQQCTGTVTIRVADDTPSDDTSSAAPDSQSENSLAYYDKAQAVYQLLQDYTANGINSFDRISQADEDRRDGLNVVRMVFACTFVDDSAAG